jgi:hypothetical protein
MPTNYIVEEDYTLDIPALNFMGDPDTSYEITFLSGGLKIEVWGTLITHPNSLEKWTAFMGDNGGSWEGIQFRAGSEGNIQDCYFTDAQNAVKFFASGGPYPASSMLYPGIYRSYFNNIGQIGVQVIGASGYTNIEFCTFDDSSDPSGIGVYVRNGDLDIKYTTFFSHGNNLPQLHIRNSDVYAEGVNFAGLDQPGNLVHIEENSNQTILDNCKLQMGVAGEYYIRADGCSPLIDNCSFETKDGQLSVNANDDGDIPAHPILLNPASILPGNDKAPFDNSTMNATGTSRITLKWYMDVNVRDPNDNHIENAPVWVKDCNGNSSEPSSKMTDSNGWAKWFIVTELIQYNVTTDIFNPFNVSAMNNSIIGYADPEPSMNLSKAVTIIVPFSQIPNIIPEVTWISTPSGIQSGNINIDFILEDPNPGDDGNMSISVEYSTDGILWESAVAANGSDLDHLLSNTIYHFVWDSANPQNLQNNYSATVYIRIIPRDRAENGTLNQTGSFTVDNKAPDMVVTPAVTFLTNDTAIIEWTVNEDANPTVWFGLDSTATDEQTGSGPSQVQTVVLTGLIPGRQYTYYVNSTDLYGNTRSTYPGGQILFTKVHIPLNKGWNLISLPPDIPDINLAAALAPIAGHYDAVQYYDPSDINGDYWKHNKAGKTSGNDLDFVIHEMCIWIHMINTTLFVPDQNVPVPGGPAYSIPMGEGWNLVGYPSSIKQDVFSALGTLDYDVVMTFDAASGRWLRYEKGSGGNLAEMEIGHGYYIHVPSETFWNVDYA